MGRLTTFSDKAMDINEAIMIGSFVFGSIIVIAIITLAIIFIKRKLDKKEITQHGTDRSDFSKTIIKEYYEERQSENGL